MGFQKINMISRNKIVDFFERSVFSRTTTLTISSDFLEIQEIYKLKSNSFMRAKAAEIIN